MPLKPGASKAAITYNIKTLIEDYKRRGAIGTSHPKSTAKARKQAVAISLSKAKRDSRT